ncbi:MAG TPA: hypothetical protein VES21_04825 [Nocardioidaceae bacterium]|nr:hypothetical protein [Nocardioidaceae bacterium]
MSRGRRVQRNVRAVVAAVLLVVSAVAVFAAVASSTAVGAAAIVSVVAGGAAALVLHREVTQTRRAAARTRARQARSFSTVVTRASADHARLVAATATRLGERERTIRRLQRAVGLAVKRADIAEQHAAAAEQRAVAAEERATAAQAQLNAEAERARASQARLSELLDAVLSDRTSTPAVDDTADADGDGADVDDALPAVIDLLAWEERNSSTRPSSPRRHA